MKITVLDDYFDTLRTLQCIRLLDRHEVRVWNDHTDDVDVLAERLVGVEALVLIRERTAVTSALLERRIGEAVAGYGRAFGMNVLVWGSDASLQRARSTTFNSLTSSTRSLPTWPAARSTS